MRVPLLPAAGLTTAALLIITAPASAQQVPATPAPAPAEAPMAPAAAGAPARPGPLFKLGTGLTNGSGYGGYGGLSLPLVLGIEQQLAPGWSATLTGASLWNIGHRRSLSSSHREGPNLRGLSVDAGIRHYYHRQQRQARGRYTGTYQGPYMALQLDNYLDRTRYNYDKQHLVYDYSSLTLQWGVQAAPGRPRPARRLHRRRTG